jgi:hypothetical protein
MRTSLQWGKSFPAVDSEEELLATFLSGSQDTVVISVQYVGPGVIKMIGGCMVVLNSSDRPVLEVLQNREGAQSLIPTFQSLYLKDIPTTLTQLIEGKHERDIANPVRFWRQDTDTLKRLRIEDRSLAQKIVACIPLSYVTFALSKKRAIPPIAIVDTHDEGIIKLIEGFGAKLLAENGILAPTGTVLNGVLKYHYGGESVGGYFGQISISYFDTDLFLKSGAEYLHKEAPDMWEKY